VALCRLLPYGRCTAPSKGDGGTLEGKTDDYSTPAQDYAVMSGRRGQSLRHHRSCAAIPAIPNTIPGIVSPSPSLWGDGVTRRRHAGCCAPCGLLLAATWSQCTDDDHTGDPTPPPSKPLLDGYRAHHDAPPDARFARTAVYSMALRIMQVHVDKTMQHACKLPPPWPIKGGAVPQP
jgi:hypothetical protein